MGSISLKSVRKHFGSVEVIEGLDLEIEDGKLTVFVGPSGCGKSTLLRMIAGLEDIDHGSIEIDGVDVTETAPAKRGVAMVFQNYALYPHMTAYDNIAYGLRRAGTPKAEVHSRVRKVAAQLQIENLLDRRPKAMSGGQRQRVAIGRAIVREPRVFLFDEPLSNLDAALRVETRMQIAQLHKDLRTTIIYVTHDQVEAMTLADKIVVMRAGRVEQAGRPLELYEKPANVFVGRFIGTPSMNLLAAEIVDTSDTSIRVRVTDLGTEVDISGTWRALPRGASVTLGVRPERVRLSSDEANGARSRIEAIERFGGETILYLRVNDGAAVVAKCAGNAAAESGDTISIDIDFGMASIFDGDENSIRLRDSPHS